MITEEELGQALHDDKDNIEVEFDLAKKVLRIKATGKVTWGACVVVIAVAVTAGVVVISTGGTATPIAGPAAVVSFVAGAPVIAASIGIPAFISAVGIAIAGGGVGALNKLRKYRVEKISDDKIILHRK